MSETVSECVECGSTKNVVTHHVTYEPEETVDVCASCHGLIHNEESHPLHPKEPIPDDFIREYNYHLTMIPSTKDARDRLRAEKQGGETYSETIHRLINELHEYREVTGEEVIEE